MNIFSHIRQDLPASVVVLFVAVPLCLGIALASGAPLFAGLIAGIVGGIVVGCISGSQLGVSGPAAGLAVIVYGAIAELGYETFLAAVVLGGVIQILLGLARAGVVAYFFPSSVIKGMLAGIGILIVMKQIPHAFGHDTDPEGDMAFEQPDGETTLSSLKAMIADIEPVALGISVTALVLLILWEKVFAPKAKFFRLFQGPLAVVALGIAYQALASRFFPDFALTKSHLVKVPVVKDFSEIPSLFQLPNWSRLNESAVWVTATTIGVVASLETLLCVEATDKLDPQKRVTPTNRELVAQGTGNIVSGMVGGLPVTQVIVRSSANIQSGGQTKLSAILHGVFLLGAVFLLPTVLNMLPLAVLASILFVVGYKLAKPALFRAMWKLGPDQFVPFVVTVAGIYWTDLLTGIGLGLAVAIFVILKRSYQNSHFMDVKRADSVDNRPVVSIKLAEEVTFLNRGAILKTLDGVPNGAHVVIDRRASVMVDHDVEEIIRDFSAAAENKDITVEVISGTPSVPASAVAS